MIRAPGRDPRLGLLPLLMLCGCNDLLQGLGEALVLVALIWLAMLGALALMALAVATTVVRRFSAGQAIPVWLKGVALAVLLVHGLVVWDTLDTSLGQQGRADALVWIMCLSLSLTLVVALLALRAPASPRSPAWTASVGAAVLGAAAVVVATALGLWPWTERAVPPSGAAVELAQANGATCVRTDRGEVACWGDNEQGQTGAGARPWRRERPSLVQKLGRADQLVGGTTYLCARSDGRLWCWGGDPDGELSLGLEEIPVPTPVPGLGEVVEIGATGGAIWAREAGGRLVGFGSELSFDRAHGARTLGTLPADTVEVAVGESFWCARRASGAVVCGAEDGASREQALGARSLGATRSEVCAVTGEGEVRCWSPRLWLWHDDEGPLDAAAVDGVQGARSIYASQDHLCVLTQSGEVRCWGQGFRGQLGDGSVEHRADARPVTLPGPAARLQVGEDYSCAWLEDGRSFCWGQPLGVDPASWTQCHDTWLGPLNCVPRPAEARLLP